MPKVSLQKDPLLRYQVGLSRELGMTFGRFVYEMDRFGRGELALQVAYDELEQDARSKAAERTKNLAKSLQRFGGRY